MYPGVIVEYNDQSDFTTLPITEVRTRPLMLALFSSDKGTEEWNRVSGSDFFDMYGKNISFAKHGQPLLQAAMTINAGGELLCKRIVAPDSALANIGIIASLVKSQVQATDADGNPLYIDGDGNETTEPTRTVVNENETDPTPTTDPTDDSNPSGEDSGSTDGEGEGSGEGGSTEPTTTTVDNDPLMKDSYSIKYTLKSATNITTNVEDASAAIKETLADGEYLLYTIADNGRGVSRKRIKIVPNYRLSKSLDYTLYTFYVIEGDVEDESMSFSVNPNLIVNDQNISLPSMIKTYSTQLTCTEDFEGMDAFVAAVAEKVGISTEEMYKYDPLFCCNNRGIALDGITNSDDGIDLQYSYGQTLLNGSNGVFEDYPINHPDKWSTAAIEALDGTYDTKIFNLDHYKINAVVDANYPASVKRAIESLATFREDFMYFRDMGLGLTSIELIAEAAKGEAHNMFCASYAQSYDIIDPYTKRQVTVTIGYDLAQLLVAHIDNGSILPTAGIKHDMIVRNCIYDTLSFAPTICPDPIGNQKEKMEDLRVNYASFIDNQLVIETLYTSQERNSQWSYINNVMAIQDIVKRIRTRCPAIRYSFIDGDDLERYKSDVEEAIEPYRANFKSLSLEYISDATYAANKIFYAALKVVYRDFIQTEWFKVTALSAVEVQA